MVAQKFLVNHNDSNFDLDYDTDDGLEVFKFQLFSLTSIPPDDQKIFGGEDDRIVSDDSDLIAISYKIRLISINDDEVEERIEASGINGTSQTENCLLSDEEFARMLQAEEEALMLQQLVATKDPRAMESRLRPYISQVLMYEDPKKQEEARLEERFLLTSVKRRHCLLWQRWVDAPPCDGYGGKTFSRGMGVTLSSELRYGASRIELYRCSFYWRETRFPRYNDPSKKLKYLIVISRDGVFDVTKRYTRKWGEVLSRRKISTEPVLCSLLANMTKELRKAFSPEVLSVLKHRNRNESESLKGDVFSEDNNSISLPGRQSGDKEWCISRSEFGADTITPPGSGSCPVRICRDEHVSKIYTAFCPILEQFIHLCLPKSRSIDVLEFIKGILMDLKNSPFKNRKAAIDSVSNDSRFIMEQMLPPFNELLDALHLKVWLGERRKNRHLFV